MARRYPLEDSWSHLPRKWLSSPYPWRELAGVIRRNITGPIIGSGEKIPFLERSSRWSEGAEQITLCFTGDWMPLGGRELTFGEGLIRFFADADVVVCNFEGVSVPVGRSVVMQQVHGPETIRALSRLVPVNRIVLSCANNHSADHGYGAFRDHYNHLESLGFRVVGSLDRPVIQLAPAILLETGTDWSNHPGPFLARPKVNDEPDSDGESYRILYPHWGYELELFPRPELVSRARDLLAGRDLIVGHHPHTPAPCTRLDGGAGERPVFFSMGNFCTLSRSAKNRWGMVVRVVLGGNGKGKAELRRLDWHFSHVSRKRGSIHVQLADQCPYFPEAPLPGLENPDRLL